MASIVIVALTAKRLLAAVVTASVLGTGGLAAAGAVDRGLLGGSHKTQSPRTQVRAAHATRHAAPHARTRHGHADPIDAMRPFAVAAKMIGVPTKTLYEDVLQRGMSIATVAQAHGVDPAAVIAALDRAGLEALTRDAAMLGPMRATRPNAHLHQLVIRLVNGHRGALFHNSRAPRTAPRVGHVNATH